MTATLGLPRVADQLWMLVSCSENIQAGYHRARVRSWLHVRGACAALRTVIEHTPSGDRVVTLVMTPFPANAVSLFVQECLIPEATSEADRRTRAASSRFTLESSTSQVLNEACRVAAEPRWSLGRAGFKPWMVPNEMAPVREGISMA
jgi:hypothetical protein